MSTAIPPRSSGKRTRPSKPAAGSRPAAGAKQGPQSTFRARKRRQQRLLAGGAIVVVVAVVAVIVALGASSSSGSGIDKRTPVAATTVASVTRVTPAQLANAAGSLRINKPELISGGSGTPLVSGGKPEVLYIGAEYCPYCAGERWALVLALSHFGTFSGLKTIVSSPTDTVASVPTFSFHGSTFSSPYLTFTPVETQTVSGKKLDTLTPEQQHLLTTLDNTPYVPAQSAGGIPFMDLGGYAVQDGISFDDTSMQHQTFQAIAQQVAEQSTPTAAYIAASAGALTSVLCHLTHGQSIDGGAACKAFPTPLTTAPGT